MRKLRLALGLIGLLQPAASLAWDGSPSGKIAAFEATSAENYGFRVWLQGGPAMCGDGSPGWAYVNKSYDNYDVFVSLLTSAYLAGKDVVIYTSKESSGYCRMPHILISG